MKVGSLLYHELRDGFGAQAISMLFTSPTLCKHGMAVRRGTCAHLPLLSAAVTGRQAAAHSLARRGGENRQKRISLGSPRMMSVLVSAGTIRLAGRRLSTGRLLGTWRQRPSTVLSGTTGTGTAVERHLTRLPGTRQAEDLRTASTASSLPPAVKELTYSLRCAPQGLLGALADVLGLPPKAEAVAEALGEDPEAVLTWRAQQRAEADLRLAFL